MLLFKASSNSQYTKVFECLDRDDDINFTNNNGKTPLMVACKTDNIKIVRLLLDRGARVDMVDHRGHSAMTYASKYGRLENIIELHKRNCHFNFSLNHAKNFETIDLLLSLGADINENIENPLKTQTPENVRYLISKGADMYRDELLYYYLRYFTHKSNLHQYIRVLADNDYDMSHFVEFYVFRLNINTITELLRGGARPNEESLVFCAANNHIEDMKLFLDYDCQRLEPDNNYSDEMNDVLENYYYQLPK